MKQPLHDETDSLIQRYRGRVANANRDSGVRREWLFENRIVFTTTEFAARTGLSLRTIQRMIKSKKIGFIREGRRVLIPTSAVETWLNQME